jgi:acetyl esterase/lipase
MRKVPEGNSFLADTISPSVLSNAEKIIKDVSYSSVSPNDKLDIYLPKNAAKPYPVIIYFHGGAFMFGEKDDSSLEPMLRGLAKGFAVVSVQYRLSGEARFPAMVFDAKTAIRYVHAKADEYGFDEKRIALWGPSSGGWLVSMAALTEGNPAFEDRSLGYPKASDHVAAVIDWCGPVSGFV